MYELFILEKLMHRPMHGYLLQSIINAALGPFRRVSWGTLYPLLRRLEQAGFIAVEANKSSDGRRTTNYRIMRLGRLRFFEPMRATGDQGADYRDLFRVKLSNFGHVGKRTGDRSSRITARLSRESLHIPRRCLMRSYTRLG
jgi:DNA-binding PadR family transcriptional regulator